jgi:hypothetical protein
MIFIFLPDRNMYILICCWNIRILTYCLAYCWMF